MKNTLILLLATISASFAQEVKLTNEPIHSAVGNKMMGAKIRITRPTKGRAISEITMSRKRLKNFLYISDTSDV